MNILPVRINTVVTGNNDEQQLRRLHEFALSVGVELKLVPDWRTPDLAMSFIDHYLATYDYHLIEVRRILPGSNIRRRYQARDASIVEVKDIEHFRPDFLCQGCTIMDRCRESFSFVRVERSPARFRLCIYKPEIEEDAFVQILHNELAPRLAAIADSTN
jgi:hypothetical protein